MTRLGSKDADLTRADALDRFAGPFDQIYHLAAWTQAGDFCLHHPGEQWVRNQQINTNVLAWWQARQPQAKLIAMGTSCAYALRPAPFRGELSGRPADRSLFTYAMTKRMLYAGLLALQQAIRPEIPLPCALRRCTAPATTPTAGRCTSSST